MPIPDSRFQEFPELRKIAADLMLKHRLPITVSKTLLAGYGNGFLCRLCGRPITHTEIEYELTDSTFTREGIRLHLWCHAAWQMELTEFMSSSSTTLQKTNVARVNGIVNH